MVDPEMEETFRSLAGKYLLAERIDALLRQLWSLEDLPKARTLVEMTIHRSSTVQTGSRSERKNVEHGRVTLVTHLRGVVEFAFGAGTQP